MANRCSVDICFATRAHTTPEFDWRHSRCLADIDSNYLPDSQALRMLHKTGKGFHEIKELRCLDEAIRYVRDVVVALDQHQRGGQNAPSLPSLLRARNAVQHHLLCLPSADSIQNMDCVNRFLYNICRLGFLIFSNMALFPLPMESGVAERLVTMLRETLSNIPCLEDDNVWLRYSGVLTWVVLLGGISSTSTSARLWYVSYLGNIIPTVYTLRWRILEDEVLSTFIWWRHVCDQLGESIWMEACSIYEK